MRFCFLAVFLFASSCLPAQPRRPFHYADTDNWRSLSGQKLSANGLWLGYGLFPQNANGEVVLRHLQNNTELREPAGLRPPPPPPDPERETPPPQRTTTLAFTADASFAVFTTFPPKGQDKATAGLVITNLVSSQSSRLADINSFQLPADSSSSLAYLRDDNEKTLVLRRLADSTERTFPGVTSYSFSKDGLCLVFATAEGVFLLNPEQEATAPTPLVQAKGRYDRFTWDDKQTLLAFLSADTLFLWDRKPGPARPAVTNAQLGTLQLAERGTLDFSRDGARLFFPTAPPRPAPTPDNGPKINYDLWHWKDDAIQPIQKVRAALERIRSYRADLHLADSKVVQLGGPDLPEISPNQPGLFAIAADDRPYRPAIDFGDGRLTDQYLLNTLTGDKRLLGRQRFSTYSWSPDGRFATRYDSKDWLCLNVSTGQEANLTAGINLAFHNEDNDTPSRPNAYAPPVWSRDGRAVLLADRYDIWQISPDGRLAKNLTDGLGRRRKIQFRLVRTDSDERQDGLDATRPLLLSAESLESRETGFFTDLIDGSAEPRQLIWSNKKYKFLARAKSADTYLVSIESFREFPDFHVTSSAMTGFQKVTDANPQLASHLWGTAELMPFRSSDGISLQAALYKPEGFDPNKKYPVLVYLYERLSQTVNDFKDPQPRNSINIPIYVSNGYIVITPDIVYRTGFPGDSAMACVIPAVQKLIEQGFVDESRIGIQGHSWGGYQIAYMLTRTNLFRAASPGAVVTNMLSAYNGIRWGSGRPRQFQYEHAQSRIGGNPWQLPLRFIENSPLFRADQIQTPVLTIHNDSDDAVPWYQGIEFYLALRRLNKEIYLFNYNGEPHNLRIRANQRHYSDRMLEFFDFFLKGAPKPSWMERGRPFLEREPLGRRTSESSDEDMLNFDM
ncbi:MAG: S9 family peptidase [Acidobacteriota bacterium]